MKANEWEFRQRKLTPKPDEPPLSADEEKWVAELDRRHGEHGVIGFMRRIRRVAGRVLK